MSVINEIVQNLREIYKPVFNKSHRDIYYRDTSILSDGSKKIQERLYFNLKGLDEDLNNNDKLIPEILETLHHVRNGALMNTLKNYNCNIWFKGKHNRWVYNHDTIMEFESNLNSYNVKTANEVIKYKITENGYECKVVKSRRIQVDVLNTPNDWSTFKMKTLNHQNYSAIQPLKSQHVDWNTILFPPVTHIKLDIKIEDISHFTNYGNLINKYCK